MATFKEAFTDFMDQKDLKYQDYDERAVRVTWNSKVVRSGVSVLTIFDSDNGNRVHFIGNNFISIPDEKTSDVIVACNALNKKYRWFKFYVDTDGDLMVEDDAILSLDNVCDECMEIIVRMVRVIEEVYPSLMRIVWG